MKKNLEDYREGAIGALLDEHEKAMSEYLDFLERVNQEEFLKIVDPDTKDDDCRSFQTISNHVVNAGYGYCSYIRNQFEGPTDRIRVEVNEVTKVRSQLNDMFEYMVQTLTPLWNITDEEFNSNIIISPWGQKYDLEEMLEHSIVHILRHRRQLEKFLIRIGKT